MLEEQRRAELFDPVLDEVGRVRAEMGYPIIVTPVSQMVATQAVRNVIDAERWSNVSDETIRYSSVTTASRRPRSTPTSPTACSRAPASTSSARSSRCTSRRPRTLRPGISDEELLLRLTMPEEQVDAISEAPREPRERARRRAARATAGASPS